MNTKLEKIQKEMVMISLEALIWIFLERLRKHKIPPAKILTRYQPN
jgi:hypothetical protein